MLYHFLFLDGNGIAEIFDFSILEKRKPLNTGSSDDKKRTARKKSGIIL
jgi:hypothetical protein